MLENILVISDYFFMLKKKIDLTCNITRLFLCFLFVINLHPLLVIRCRDNGQ